MTAEQIAAIAGAILSLAFSYIPGIRQKYEAPSAEVKRLVMLGLLVLAVAGIFALACSRFGANLRVSVSCDEPGMIGLFWSLVLAVMANQFADHLFAPSI